MSGRGPIMRPGMVSAPIFANPVWPRIAPGKGHYESFYLRAADPDRPRAVWIRYTVHKRPGQPPLGSLWFTLFDDGVHAVKQTFSDPVPADWIEIGGAHLGPTAARGAVDGAEWDLVIEPRTGGLRHLPFEAMYAAPIPRTKPESPIPDATFDGRVRFGGRELDVTGWRGMAGHNWGTEHADTWIWLHGVAFGEDESAWLDLTVARVRLGPVTTPWIANGALERGGRRRRLRGPARVEADAHGARIAVGGVRLSVAARDIVVWSYASPDLEERHSAHSSNARVELTDGERTLTSAHACAYELGVRPGGHGDLPVQPYPDGV
jgi:hypothetical protein